MLRLFFAALAGFLVTLPSITASAAETGCGGHCAGQVSHTTAIPCSQDGQSPCCEGHGCGLFRCGLLGCGQVGCGHFGGGPGKTCCACEMPQHHSYYPEMHGYYYFRPYNWSMISEQEQTAASWGEDLAQSVGASGV